MIDQVPGQRGSTFGANPFMKLLSKIQEQAGSFSGLSSLIDDATEKELNPFLPCSTLAYVKKMIVVLLSVTLKEGAQV